MYQRERIEDLGRMAEMLDGLMNDDLFSSPKADWDHKKQCDERGVSPMVERCWDDYYIEGLLNQIADVKGKICEIWHLARYGDEAAEL